MDAIRTEALTKHYKVGFWRPRPYLALDGLTLHVDEMPEFKVGDRELLFVETSGRALCPLVAFGYGRMHVVHNGVTGVDEVRTHHDWPFFSQSRARTNALLSLKETSRPDLASAIEQVRQKVASLGTR